MRPVASGSDGRSLLKGRLIFALRNRHFLLIDLVLLPAAAVLSFVLRLDVAQIQRHLPAILLFVALAVPIKQVVFRLAE